MEIQNKNTFTDETVTVKKNDNESIVVYIGKNCYDLSDLEKIVIRAKTNFLKSGDDHFKDSLNYRTRTYNNE